MQPMPVARSGVVKGCAYQVCSCEAGHTHLPRHALGSLRRVNFFFGLGFF